MKWCQHEATFLHDLPGVELRVTRASSLERAMKTPSCLCASIMTLAPPFMPAPPRPLLNTNKTKMSGKTVSGLSTDECCRSRRSCIPSASVTAASSTTTPTSAAVTSTVVKEDGKMMRKWRCTAELFNLEVSENTMSDLSDFICQRVDNKHSPPSSSSSTISAPTAAITTASA